MVVDDAGRPLSEIGITITEITTSTLADQWQQWSVQRFGPMISEKSGSDGRLLLDYPAKIDGQSVPWVRVAVKGRVGDKASVNRTVSLPTREDGRVLSLTPSDQPPPRDHAYRSVSVRYVDPAELVDASPRQMLDQLVKGPSLFLLRQLLKAAHFDDAEPLELKPKRNRAVWDSKSAVIRIQSPEGERVVVLCSVRPRGATWKDRPRGRSAPEAAIVFRSDGSLTTMLGGGFSARGSGENAQLTNLGTTGDHLVRVSAFEEHGPFELISRWYRIGSETSAALTVHHYANSNSWSGGMNGRSNPVSEFGFLGYEFNGRDIEHHLPGVTAGGLLVPRRIFWDGQQNRFIGPVTQSFDGRPLYRVVTDASAEFQPLNARPGEIIVGGGRRDYRNWHQWIVVVQQPQAVVARLVLSDNNKEKRQLLAETLQPGQHSLQLQIDPDGQTETESTVRIRIDGGDEVETVFKIPRLEIDARPSVPNQPVAVSQPAPVRLFDKKLAAGQASLVWKIEDEKRDQP